MTSSSPGPAHRPAGARSPGTERKLTAGAGLAALGIVYGDLGTSPLYTFQTILGGIGGHASAGDVLGLLSLIVWALILVVSLKYCVLVMRADNHGEGGILALLSLAAGRDRRGGSGGMLVAMGLFGAALIYGDGIITPAISVLSALEGINVATTALKPVVLPGAIVILVGLFAAQQTGTARIGKVFGPVMLCWFLTIGVLGFAAAVRHPQVVAALDPRHAAGFLAGHGWQSFVVLGGVFLAITGGEALYADMGHIGRGPIRLAWYGLVLPCLLLSYAGQAALLIAEPELAGNPFFHMAPSWAVVPLVVLATLATIIASQAIITGAFSLTRQAMQLDWFPGLTIRQTSDREYGQIYVPFINWAMMAGTVALAYGFGSSERLAGAYGTAVSTTMLLTTVLLFKAMRDVWHWPLAVAGGLGAAMLALDLAFFGANMLKLLEGGWVPLLLGGAVFLVMTTWQQGIAAVRARAARSGSDADVFLAGLAEAGVRRVPGTAVFLGRGDRAVPSVLASHVAQVKALQDQVVSLTVHFGEVPRLDAGERASVEQIGEGMWRVRARFGFMEIPNLIAALQDARAQGCACDPDEALFVASRDAVVRSPDRPRLPAWRRIPFAFMYRNAVRSSDRFQLPPDRFLEVIRQVEL